MVDKTYGTGVAHLRTEKTITDSGDATEYPNSQVIISGEDYVIMRISNGVEWFSLGIGPTNRMPSASVFGKGSWKSDVLYLSDGVSFKSDNNLLSSTSGASLVGYINKFTGARATTIGQWASWQKISVFEFMSDAQIDDVKAGTANIDLSASIQAAIDSIVLAGEIIFPVGGVYRIDNTLTILGNTKNVNLSGTNGVRSIIPGGTKINSGAILEWHGANDLPMLVMNSTDGSHIENICFQTYSTFENDIQITGVTGIQYICRSSCRFTTIAKCQFSRLDKCIHYFDDFLDAASDNNMDGHTIYKCAFNNYVVGVNIEQTNVYDTDIVGCSFYGSIKYTKNHVLITKGHCYLRTVYLGTLKDAASVGGKDGISLHIIDGWMNAEDVYGECHNGPFFVWDADSHATGVTCTLTGCNILNATASLPTTYNILNNTAYGIVIVGGRIAGAVKQLSGIAGTITYIGTAAPSADATGDLDRVMYYGGLKNSRIGNIGTMGTGIATISGTAPALQLYDNDLSASIDISHNSNILSLNRAGLNAGPSWNFSTRRLDYSSANWTINYRKTITPAGTVGDQTIDAPIGSVNLAAGATSLVVTNNLIDVNSTIQLTVGTNDTAMKSAVAVAAAGSFTIYPNAAPSAETKVFFTVTN